MHTDRPYLKTKVGQVYELDSTDSRILLAFDEHPSATLLEIAQLLRLSRNTVQSRMKRLRDQGVLGAPSRFVDPLALGKPLLAFVTLSVQQRQVSTLYDGLAKVPEVIEAHTVTGNSDVLLKVVAENTRDLHRITQEIQSLPGVQRSSTSIATTEVISHRTFPLLRGISAQ